MRAHVLALTLLIAATAQADERWVERTLRSLSLDEKIGQLLVPVTRGGFRNIESEDFAKIARDLKEFHVGGYHVQGGDAAGMAVLINDIQRTARVPLLITADLEGGTGWIAPAGTRFPLAMSIGATGSEQLAYMAGKASAMEGKALGINVNFYPVADVQINPANPIINIRSFGEDVKKVSELTSAYVRGVQDGGMIATVKHFPGHGDVASDSHLELPVLTFDRKRLDAVELPPFRAAIAADVGAVMSAHIFMPSLEEKEGVPATMSYGVLTRLLRDDLGFKGLVFTDAMDMHAITKNFGEGDAAVRSIEAGADLVLYAYTEPSFNAIKEAVQSGRLTEKRIDDSVRRILRAKWRVGLGKYQPANVNSLSTVVGSRANRELSQRISDEAITLVRDERSSLPLRPDAEKRVLHVNILDSRIGWREGPVGRVLAEEIPKRFPKAVTVEIDDLSVANELTMTRTMADMVDAVVVTAFIRVAAYKGSIDLTEAQTALIKDLAAMQKPFVFVIFGSPYLLHHIPELPSYVVTYDTHPAAEMAAVKAITGEIPFKGKLPISLPGLHPVGHGLSR